MRIVRSVAGMQALAKRWKRAGVRIGFVPTMGFLHAGHLDLVRQARRKIGRSGRTVLSIFVNPTQFGRNEDFSKYPRDLNRDLAFCRKGGVDVVFAPADEEMYPGYDAATYSTYVVEENLGRVMEGASRPTHFRGVTTVVAKLFNIVLPDVAVFGAKDFQQAAIIRRMTRDLNFAVNIVVAETVRESDGLAMSSRNQYLSATERAQAAVLWRAIQDARRMIHEKGSIPASELRKGVAKLIRREPDAKLDYVEIFDPETLKPLRTVGPGAHLALAVFVGKTRLIDNAPLGAVSGSPAKTSHA